MTLDEAKKIVLEKYPYAIVTYRQRNGYQWAVWKKSADIAESQPISDYVSTKNQAWLSAVQKILNEKGLNQ